LARLGPILTKYSLKALVMFAEVSVKLPLILISLIDEKLRPS